VENGVIAIQNLLEQLDAAKIGADAGVPYSNPLETPIGDRDSRWQFYLVVADTDELSRLLVVEGAENRVFILDHAGIHQRLVVDRKRIIIRHAVFRLA
jgi:hypothetical protein